MMKVCLDISQLAYHGGVATYTENLAEELQKNIVELRNLCDDIATIEVIPVFQDIAINHFPMSKELVREK